jgi:hypothetical protein
MAQSRAKWLSWPTMAMTWSLTMFGAPVPASAIPASAIPTSNVSTSLFVGAVVVQSCQLNESDAIAQDTARNACLTTASSLVPPRPVIALTRGAGGAVTAILVEF